MKSLHEGKLLIQISVPFSQIDDPEGWPYFVYMNMRISTMKTKTMAFQGKNHIICNIAINNKTTEQV
jgi:hypothetical protein